MKFIYKLLREQLLSRRISKMKPKSEYEEENRDSLLLKQVRYKSAGKLVLLTLTMTLSSFYFGYGIGYLGTFDFDVIYDIFGITLDKDSANGLLQACVPVGAGIGALSSFLLFKYFSRRNSILLVNLIVLIITALSLIPNQFLIFFARFIQGVCIGFYSALAPVIVKQFSPTEISGSLGALVQFSVAFGVFFSNLLQFVLVKIADQEYKYWRIMFGLPLVTVTLQSLLILFVYKHETPKYLMEKGRQEDCEKVIRYIYKQQFVSDVLKQKREQVFAKSVQQSESNLNKPSIVSENQEGSKQEIAKNNQQTYRQNQEAPKSKIRLIVAVHLSLLQQFVGINAVVAYGPAIVIQVLPDWKNLIPVFLNLEQTVSSFTTSYLLSKFGRKTIIQRGTIVFVISLLLIAVGFILIQNDESPTTLKTSIGNVLVIVGLIIFMADFGLSLGPTVWLSIPQIVEPSKVPIAVGANWGAATIIMFLFPILKSYIGLWPQFMFFAVYTLFGFFFSQKYLIETKDKQQSQIYEEYDKIK